MGKKPKPKAPEKPRSGVSAAALAAGGAILVALLLGLVLSQRPSAAADQPDDTSSAFAPAEPLGDGLLDHFSAEHNASLEWGTYRPGVYFGMRSRTAPGAVVAGLMWAAHGTSGVSAEALRHNCEQDHLERYGFTAHDGRGFASQPIVDRKNGVSLRMSLVKPEGGGAGWAVRVSGEAASGAAEGRPQSVFFYLGIESEYAAGGRVGGLQPGEALGFLPEGSAHLSGEAAGVGAFSLLAAGRGATPESQLRARSWGLAEAEAAQLEGPAYVRVREVVLGQLQQSSGLLGGGVPDGTQLAVVQIVAAPPFELDFVFVPGGCGAGAAAASCEAAFAALSGDKLSAAIAERQAGFEAQLSQRFKLDELQLGKAPLTQPSRDFAAAVLGSVMGSLGFFYGSSLVAGPDGSPRRTPPAPLYTVVPSRPFFPRGFLWDDGFHQLIVGAWDPAIADDMLAHWLGMMHDDGWIPREQARLAILGAESEGRVPAEFVQQHQLHANPPALILRLDSLLRSLDALPPAEAEGRLLLLRRALPRLERWYAWFVRTQAGPLPHTFRWRGRDPADTRLNALTLSSGLDDYPRAAVPSEAERHVDLLCWVAFFSRLLSQLAARLDLPAAAGAYRKAHEAQLASLSRNHWHGKLQAFCDQHGGALHLCKFL